MAGSEPSHLSRDKAIEAQHHRGNERTQSLARVETGGSVCLDMGISIHGLPNNGWFMMVCFMENTIKTDDN